MHTIEVHTLMPVFFDNSVISYEIESVYSQLILVVCSDLEIKK